MDSFSQWGHKLYETSSRGSKLERKEKGVRECDALNYYYGKDAIIGHQKAYGMCDHWS